MPVRAQAPRMQQLPALKRKRLHRKLWLGENFWLQFADIIA